MREHEHSSKSFSVSVTPRSAMYTRVNVVRTVVRFRTFSTTIIDLVLHVSLTAMIKPHETKRIR